jgi:hypothetical protein
MDGAEAIVDGDDQNLDELSTCSMMGHGAAAMAFGTSSFRKRRAAPHDVSPGDDFSSPRFASPRSRRPSSGPEDPQLKSNLLRLRLREVEVQKLHKLDIANQSFNATIWMEFVIPGGALSESLSAGHADRPPTQHFPCDPDTGKPTFMPSATWYMAQLDCRNALAWRLVDGKVMRRGDDLIMAVRVEGTFVEVFELNDYPFDSQGLTCTLNFKCAARACATNLANLQGPRRWLRAQTLPASQGSLPLCMRPPYAPLSPSPSIFDEPSPRLCESLTGSDRRARLWVSSFVQLPGQWADAD